MPTKPIDRLLFSQGGNCFFCRHPIPNGEASVEHLVAEVNGGGGHDENCVACCKTLNRLLGHMSLKEKLNVILNQKGDIRCPARAPNGTKANAIAEVAAGIAIEASSTILQGPLSLDEQIALVVLDLHKRGNAKPGKEEGLINTIRSALIHKEQAAECAEKVLKSITARGFVSVLDGKVTGYNLPPR